MKTRLSNFWWFLPNPLKTKCIQNCINWLICLDQITNVPQDLATHLTLSSLYCNNKLWPLTRTELVRWKTSRGMSSAEFLHFIKAEAIWTEWRGQSMWPGTVWDDPFLTPSLSCALCYGRVSRLFLSAREIVVQRLLGHRRGQFLDVRSSQLHLFRLSAVAPCCWHRSKQDPPRRGGMRINCFLQVQRAIPAVCFIGPPLRFHMLGEICSSSPDELACTRWSALWTEKSSRAAHWLSSQQN